MNNLFYSLEDGKYYTYPDGDEATAIQIREVIEANERSISKLQQENKQLNEDIKVLFKENCNKEEVIKRHEDNWNKLKEWASNFYNSEEVGWAGCGMRYTLEKILELEQGSDSNE